MSCEPSDFKVKYKTEYCKYWKLSGNCPFLEQCAFAHGDYEIRHKTHLPQNYKTKRCKNFFENGYCSYGERCQFLHVNGDIFSESSGENNDNFKQQIIKELPENAENQEKSPIKYEQQLNELDQYWDQNTLSFQTPKLLNRPRLATFESIASSSPGDNYSQTQNQNQTQIPPQNQNQVQNLSYIPQQQQLQFNQQLLFQEEHQILELQEQSSSDKSTAFNSKQNSSENQKKQGKNKPARKQSKGVFNVNAKEFDFPRSVSPINSQTTNNPESVEELQI